jgi:hypothetical protein
LERNAALTTDVLAARDHSIDNQAGMFGKRHLRRLAGHAFPDNDIRA